MTNEVVTKHAGGRPTTFGIDHPCWMAMCRQISEGRSLSTALKSDGMPSYYTAMMMLRNNLDFRAMYEKAIESRADRLAEEILELADESMPSGLEGAQASAWVQQKRLQVDARKWVAAKLKPKKYSDRIAHVGDNESDAININVNIFDEMIINLELKRQAK